MKRLWMRTPVEPPKKLGELFDNLSDSKELRQVRDTSEGSSEMAATCCGLENRHEESAPAQVLRDKGGDAQRCSTVQSVEVTTQSESAPVSNAAPTFNPKGAADLRDKGIRQVTDHNKDWMERAIEKTQDIPCSVEATGEDIRFLLQSTVGFPKHHNAWGALIKTLIKRRIIVPTGAYRPMRDKVSHARRTPVYRRA